MMNAFMFVVALVCAATLANYVINRKLGMPSTENLRDTKMWGVGFAVYAALDHVLLIL